MMEDSRPYLEEKGLAELDDAYTADRHHQKVSFPGESLIGRGVKKVRRDDPIIEQFLSVIPDLCCQQAPCGLLWHEDLYPYNGSFDPSLHYIPTGQPKQKSAHGMVEFYKDQTSGANFAIKVLQKKDAFRAQEICSRLCLQHVNIADVYGVIVRFGAVHILMEHAGKPLTDERAWFAESPDRMLQFAKQAFRSLEFLHVKGYVHCDIKPDNLMIIRDGKSFTLKIIDFGTCRKIGEPLPPQAHTTWQYWPPEMWKTREKKETFTAESSMDVYAMALTLYFVQMGSHLMLKIPKQAMMMQPDFVKMMGIPESIPPELRAVMNHCLEVNKVQRCTAEEALTRLFESEPVYQSSRSSKEEYLANLRSIDSGDVRQDPLIDNLIQQAGSSRAQLPPTAVINSNVLLRNEEMRGPAAVRFERKTSKIFQDLKKIESQKSRSRNSRQAIRPTTEIREAPRIIRPGPSLSHPVVEQSGLSPYRNNEIQGTYPYASLLGKLAQEVKTQPQDSLSSNLKQVSEIPLASSNEITRTLGKFDKPKSFSCISRQKSRAKIRQKSYDRNATPAKGSARKLSAATNPESKVSSKVSSVSENNMEPKSHKLWPLAEIPQDVDGSRSLEFNTKEDDMDCVIDLFDPEAFQLEDITDYMFQMVEKQENEGDEIIRRDMDGMSLSGPEVNVQQKLGDKSSMNYQDIGLREKPKISDIIAPATEGLPNFDDLLP